MKKLLAVLFVVFMEILIGLLGYMTIIKMAWGRFFSKIKIVDDLSLISVIVVVMVLIFLVGGLGYFGWTMIEIGKWMWKEADKDSQKRKTGMDMLPISPK